MSLLLEKFEAVEVTADTRIDEADRYFCQVQQEAYDHARTALQEIIDLCKSHEDKQHAIRRKVETEVYNLYLNLNTSRLIDDLRESHGQFVKKIFSYFRQKYAVDIDSATATKNLLPKEPDRGYFGDGVEAWEKYSETMSTMRVEYSDVVDQIFLQLDGLSFEDKAVKEIKDAAHKAAWNEYHGSKRYEQKKAVISFTCGCQFDSWYARFDTEEHHIKVFDWIKDVIKAIVHFEFGQTGYTPSGLLCLLGYDWKTKEPESQVNTERLKSVKCFKNGRVDFRFTNESYARQFVEEYLGTTL